MDPTNSRPLPDQSAFEPGEKPKLPQRIVRDSEGKEIQPPDIKKKYHESQEKRRHNNQENTE